MRMSRWAGLFSVDKLPLKNLFSDMVYVNSKGRSSSATTMGSAGSLSLSISTLSEDTPYYVFYMTGTNFEISKLYLTSAETTKTQLNIMGSRGFVVSGSNITSNGNIYTGSLTIVRFPSYPEERIDKTLTDMSLMLAAGVYKTQGQSRETVSIASSDIVQDDAHIYVSSFVAPTSGYNDYMSCSLGKQISSPIFSSGGQTYPYLCLDSGSYYLSLNGTSSRSVYGGGIYVLS